MAGTSGSSIVPGHRTVMCRGVLLRSHDRPETNLCSPAEARTSRVDACPRRFAPQVRQSAGLLLKNDIKRDQWARLAPLSHACIKVRALLKRSTLSPT